MPETPAFELGSVSDVLGPVFNSTSLGVDLLKENTSRPTKNPTPAQRIISKDLEISIPQIRKVRSTNSAFWIMKATKRTTRSRIRTEAMRFIVNAR